MCRSEYRSRVECRCCALRIVRVSDVYRLGGRCDFNAPWITIAMTRYRFTIRSHGKRFATFYERYFVWRNDKLDIKGKSMYETFPLLERILQIANFVSMEWKRARRCSVTGALKRSVPWRDVERQLLLGQGDPEEKDDSSWKNSSLHIFERVHGRSQD